MRAIGKARNPEGRSNGIIFRDVASPRTRGALKDSPRSEQLAMFAVMLNWAKPGLHFPSLMPSVGAAPGPGVRQGGQS